MDGLRGDGDLAGVPTDVVAVGVQDLETPRSALGEVKGVFQ
ncbi:MAG: hypothetical protein R2789_12240 [Microthrixaceae bacterium]